MKKRFFSLILVLCLLLTSLPVYADVSATMIEQDIETDGSIQSNRWFTMFKDLIASTEGKKANGAKFYLVLESLRDSELKNQIGEVLDSDLDRMNRLDKYGLDQESIYDVMKKYFETFPADMEAVEADKAGPDGNLYAALYHDNAVKYSNYMLEFHKYLNELFATLPSEVRGPIRDWDAKGQGEIILYQSLLNIVIRTDLGIERYLDGKLKSRDLELLSVSEAMIVDDLENFAEADGLTDKEKEDIAEYAEMFVDFGNVILESCELNLKESGEIGNAFYLGKIIDVIRIDEDESKEDEITINVNPDGMTIYTAPEEGSGDKDYQDFDAFITGTSAGADWSVDKKDIVSIDENGLVTLLPEFVANPTAEQVSVRVRATIKGRDEYAEVILLISSPEALGFNEFLGAYISGYEDNTFRGENFVTREEMATMFTRVLTYDVKEYKKDADGVIVVDENNKRVPVYYEASDFPVPSFKDIDSDHWSYVYVERANQLGWFEADADGNFNPQVAIERGEIPVIMLMVWENEQMPVDKNGNHYIADVPTTHKNFDAIQAFYNMKIVGGFSDSTFRPNDQTTRNEIVIMINNIINRKENVLEKVEFTDTFDKHWAYADIVAATKEQLKINAITP